MTYRGHVSPVLVCPRLGMLLVMTKQTRPSLVYAALNASDSGKAPEWIELLPVGERITGRDGRAWINDQPDVLVAQFNAGGVHLPIDFEHGSEELDGLAKDIAGWITDMENRGGAIWAKAEWTDLGNTKVSSRQYKYVSPVFYYDAESLRILQITAAALTVNPNLHLTALNRSELSTPPMKESTMDKEKRRALCRSLGLADEASDDAILKATEALQGEKAKAENAAKTPDLQQFVPRADHDKLKGELETAQNSLKQGADAEIVKAVDAAIAGGKIAPGSKDYHLAACRASNEGLTAFKSFVDAAPVTDLAKNSGLETQDPAKGKAALSADEKLIADQLGIAHEDFAKNLTAEEKGGV